MSSTPKGIKVAIDSRPLATGDAVRGIGVYTSELIKALKGYKDVKILDDWESADVIHLTKFHPFFISIPFIKPKGKKLILTIYDLIPLIYPSHYPPGIRGKINFLINKFLIHKNVDAIITISETSKKDICRFLGIASEKVFVTYLAPRKIFKPITDHWSLATTQKKYGLPDSFALYVGDVNYNKNIPGLIKMCQEAGIKLVIAGKQAEEIRERDGDGDLRHAELAHLKNLDWSNVITLGFVPDEDLVALYNLAEVYIQPSFYEGFSLPPLEARTCGAWVIYSRIQAHVEILENERKYSWEKTAKDTVEVYKKLVGG